MSFFSSLNTSASGLTAQRLRMDTISQNIANVNTTRTENGGPYRRKTVVFEENNNNKFGDVLNAKMNGYSGSGVKITSIIEDTRPFEQVYDPTHPDANEEGYVLMPNVNVVEEMTNMISANRSYEANVTAINATQGMATKALEIGR
ncbi:flagellar basal-body rod protein FlgC [Natranaerovirga hydrolytica]|uniref:Flagellar basal-body rod protein FlgC n=1 Tax=Natranaerovirga hydrolytica TaxID=680378 RepID=A0A4R1MXP4_9FIRM|nr:flagellar basal body rod protein FlgC [Natranaerovirga hydrolytica]TCK97885.1 flagellar basal-body rod protein FlgC [Natranaerovirga hydrolytica]